MSRTTPLICLLIGIILLSACKRKTVPSSNNEGSSSKLHSMKLKYARGFTVDYYDGYKYITVRNCNDTPQVIARYLLADLDSPAPTLLSQHTVIDIPVRRVVCVSTNHLGAMSRLGLADSIAGVSNIALI